AVDARREPLQIAGRDDRQCSDRGDAGDVGPRAVGNGHGRPGVAEGDGRTRRAGREGEVEGLGARAAGVGDGQGEVDLGAAGGGRTDEELVRRRVVPGGGGRQVGVRGVAGHDRDAGRRGGQRGADGRGVDTPHIGERDRQVPGLVDLDVGVAVAGGLGRNRGAGREEGLRHGTTGRQERLRHDDAGAGVLVDSGGLDVDRRAGQRGAEGRRRDRRNGRLAERGERGGVRRGGRGAIEGIEAGRGGGDAVGGCEQAGIGPVRRHAVERGGGRRRRDAEGGGGGAVAPRGPTRHQVVVELAAED